MYALETPILESVFEDYAPNAADITDIISEGMSLQDVWWMFIPLSYQELVELTTPGRHRLMEQFYVPDHRVVYFGFDGALYRGDTNPAIASAPRSIDVGDVWKAGDR